MSKHNRTSQHLIRRILPALYPAWRFTLTAVLSAIALQLSGCSSLTLAIANAPAVFGDYKVERNIAYGGQPWQKLDVYKPNKGSHAIVVFFHGGGWDSGSKNQYRFVAEALTAHGYTVVVPDYSLFPRAHFPEFVNDAAMAVAWTHAHEIENTANISIDRNATLHSSAKHSKLYLMGHSAGAHLAAMLTFNQKYLQQAGADNAKQWLSGFIGLAGPYDFLPFSYPELNEIFAPRERFADSQPINFVNGDEPPVLLIHGRDDTTVFPRNSQRLAAKIRSRGGKAEEHYYEEMDHSGVLAPFSKYFRNSRPILEQIDAFITRT